VCAHVCVYMIDLIPITLLLLCLVACGGSLGCVMCYGCWCQAGAGAGAGVWSHRVREPERKKYPRISSFQGGCGSTRFLLL